MIHRELSAIALLVLLVACAADKAEKPAVLEAQSAVRCTPGWVYLKAIEEVEHLRGLDAPARNVVLVGCVEVLSKLTPKDMLALEPTFADPLTREDHEVRQVLKNPVARAAVVTKANQILGRVAINDWYVDFYAMAW